MGVNSLPKTVTRQRCGCDLNPGPPAPESSTPNTRLPSHPYAAWRRVGSVEMTNACHALLSTLSTVTHVKQRRMPQRALECISIDQRRRRGEDGG